MERKHWVLVIEDDACFRDVLTMGLEREGFTVKGASSGAEALAMLEAGHRPTVVLSDLKLPGVLGSSVIGYIDNVTALENVTVGIVTGSPELAPAGYPVFTKPVDLAVLVTFVQESIASSGTN